MEQLEAHGHFGAKFTAETWQDVRQWVQDRSVNQEIVATPARLYLPVGMNHMVAVDENDVIWWDPEAGDNLFYVERFD